jgi:hypothetical protein
MEIYFYGVQAKLLRNSTWSGVTEIFAVDLTRMNSFFTIAFASFVEAQDDFSLCFSDWLKVLVFSWRVFRVAHCRCEYRQGRRFTSRPPIPLFHTPLSSWNLSQVLFLRRSYDTRLSIFSPVHDLSSLSKSGPRLSLVRGPPNDVAISGSQVLGDEYSDHVLKVRHFVIECVAGSSYPVTEPEWYRLASGVSG